MSGQPDAWGLDDPPAVTGDPGELPPRLARLAEVQRTGVAVRNVDPYAEDFPQAEELPEVRALMRQGWRPLDPAPLYSLLPAAWPVTHRTWVPDRLPKVGMGGTTDSYWGTIAPPPDDDDWHDYFLADDLRAAGLPEPPAGRIWLLRSPWPRIPVSVVYDIIWSAGPRDAGRNETAAMYRAALDVLAWDEDRALRSCPPVTRALLDAWAAAGRVGEEAAEFVAHRLSPTAVADALQRTGLEEQGLIAWLSSLETDLDDDAVAFIRAWRDSGLPGDPPPGAHRFRHRDLADIRDWLAAGFDLYAAATLDRAGLATALRWREAGFDEADTYELLRSDPALTPEEAHAFDAAAAEVRERRREWIYYGFSAPQAQAWAAAGLTPYQARIWRACGLHPDDVQPGQRFPPQLIKGHRYIGFSRLSGGELENAEWDEIPDPPGTRGRRAGRWRRDDDPWINED